MFKRLAERVGRWRRRIDIDLHSLHGASVDEALDGLVCVIDRGDVRRAVPTLIRVVLLQSLVDRAIGVHLFHDCDDRCLRMLYCLAVPPEAKMCPRTPSSLINVDTGIREEGGQPGHIVWPDPANLSYERVWYEMVPPPAWVSDELFRRLRWHARLRRGMTEGRLFLRYEGRDCYADMVAPTGDDVRIFFTPERPPIHPKLTRHFQELGLSTSTA